MSLSEHQTGTHERVLAGAPTFRGVQALRGVAACMVVLFHASGNWSMVAKGEPSGAWQGGSGGVDIFFAISGFVMAVSSIGNGEGPKAAWRFLERRLVRVMPLYWVITTVLLLKIQLGFVRNDGLRHVSLGFGVCSYLLIPYWHGKGDASPLLTPGWTLMYEMFFYVCFAAALWMRKSVPVTLTVVLGLLSVAGMFRPELFRTDQWPAIAVLMSPLLLEFLAGLWLGRLTQMGYTLEPRVAGALGVAGLLVVWLLPAPATPGMMRLEWGICGLFVVQAAVVLEARLGRRIPRWALLVGDASYSIYLTHAPLLGLWAFLLKKAHVLVAGRVRFEDEAITLLVCLGLSVAVGIATYKLVESPMNRWFRHLLRLRRPVQTEAAAEAATSLA